MKTSVLLAISVTLLVLTACAQSEGPTATPIAAAITEQTQSTAEPTALPLRPTSEPDPSVTLTTPEPNPTRVAAATVMPSTAPELSPTPDEATTVPTSEPLPTLTTAQEPAPTAASLPTATPIACSGTLTPSQQEGPYYSPGSPERSSLIEDGMPGVPVMLFGGVFDQNCNPFAGAKLDFWLADVDGVYDNVGYTLRGHVFTDADGYYALESIEPTSYTGRPPHIHVKVFAPDGRELLTTQMYFAGSEDSAEVTNSPELYAAYLEPDSAGRLRVLFSFVVEN